MTFINAADRSDAGVFGTLEGGGTVASEVYDPEKSKAAGPVYLQAGDQVCSGCDTVIQPDEYPGAAYANILARLKLQYGHTVCADCHASLPSDA